jgi:hypothetical protein
MTRVYQNQQDCLHIKSKASGDRSLDVVTLKQSSTVYGAGTVVVAEYTLSGENSATQTATGLHVDPASVDVAVYKTVKVAVINDRVDASAGSHAAVAITNDAEVYGHLISLKGLAAPKKVVVAAALDAAGIKVR